MNAPLRVWRDPLRAETPTWFTSTPAWHWQCRLCTTSATPAKTIGRALDAALGHLAVWHTNGNTDRRTMKP